MFGASIFEYLAVHPDDGEVFNAGMTSVSLNDAAAVVAAYDSSRFDPVVDVGGGSRWAAARGFVGKPKAARHACGQRSSRGRKLCGAERWRIDANSPALISSSVPDSASA